MSFVCQLCKNSFSRLDVLKRHIQRIHSHDTISYPCNLCGLDFDSVLQLREHRDRHRAERGQFQLSESALHGSVKSYSLSHNTPTTDVMKLFSAYGGEIAALINSGKRLLYYFTEIE